MKMDTGTVHFSEFKEATDENQWKGSARNLVPSQGRTFIKGLNVN